MPDLLTHALLGYAVGLVLSWRYAWLDARYVTVVMTGTFVPDLAKIALVVPGEAITALWAVPFSWSGLHTAGGAFLAVLIGVFIVDIPYRRRVGGLLGLGAATHLVADAALLKASGHSYPLLWPVSTVAPRTPGLYLSTDVWPAVVAVVIVLGLTLVDHRWM
ncbi:metal-dependent hydrolase [Halobellus rufus]|uniref:metal-dependent hydrolase n=1 Tax=Halobellus rufus TaxID=1448860 RepID=UPI00067855FF|nr:metal-dependent hydrolase [Halobellus rufus]